MTTISELRNDETGNRYELWQVDDQYRLRVWHRSPSGVLQTSRAITLSVAELEKLGEDIHTHVFSLPVEPDGHCFRHDKSAAYCRLSSLTGCDVEQVSV